MAQEGIAEGSSTEDPGLQPQHKCGLSQLGVVGASPMPGLKPEARVRNQSRTSSRGGARPGAEGVAQASLGLSEPAVGHSKDFLPGLGLHMPTVAAQGQPCASKRLQVPLDEVFASGSCRHLCNMSLPKKVPVCTERPGGVEGADCPRPSWATDGIMGSSGGDGVRPPLNQEGSPGRSLLSSPGPPPRRARKKRRLCGVCPHNDDNDDGGFLPEGVSHPRRSSPQVAGLESFGKACRTFSSKETGAGDVGGNWAGCASGVKKFGGMLSWSASLDSSPQSPAPRASTAHQEVQSMSGVGPCWAHDWERPEVKVQPVSREKLEQGITVPSGPWVSFPEPSGGVSSSHSGLPLSHPRPRCMKKRRRNPMSSAREQHTENLHQDDLQEASPRSCGIPEEVRMSQGAKLVLYLSSGERIQLLGAISHGQAGTPRLEALEDFTGVSLASPTPRSRRRRKSAPPGPTKNQCGPVETVDIESFQQGTENPAQLQSQQESMSVDIGVRTTVVHAMQEVLWSRLRTLPDLLLKDEEVESIATGIESALFHLTQDTSGRYKAKYRSLLFNLRDPRNLDLLLKVAHRHVTPHDLVRMSSIQLAPQELSRWRDQEERRGLEIIEQQQKEPHSLPVSKMTHKGEVEILRDTDQILTLEDLVESVVSKDCSPQTLPALPEDTTEQHQHHFLNPNCLICKGGRGYGKDMGCDWQPSGELPNFHGATTDREDSVTQRSSSPVPVSSSEMSKAKDTSPKEPQDRIQMPAGPTDDQPSPPAPWEGSIDMFSIKRFRAKAQLVSGHSCRLVQALPEVIRSAGCLPPNTIWDLLNNLCPMGLKDVCVVRLSPHKSRDTQNCRLLYSYLNNKQRHCLAAVEHVGVVLLPLPAFQPLPTSLRPLGGPGLEATHSSLLLAVLLPKERLPDTVMSNPPWGKVRKTVSFNSKVEIRCYQTEDRRGSSPPEVAPQKSQAKGSLAPRDICAWERLPGGSGRQVQQPSGSGSGLCQPQHSAASVVPGFGRGQHFHRASCLHRGLFQHLNALVSMSHQLQASLWPQGREPHPPPSAASVQAPVTPQPPAQPLTTLLSPAEDADSECPHPRDT